MSLRIVFFGTPIWARPSLAALVEGGHDVAAVVTQPDRRAGRGRRLTAPPVKVEAEALGLPVLQPESAKGEAVLNWVKGFEPDLLVIVACGFILPDALLAAPKLMPVNLHFSLLPEFRGSAPVAWALIKGREEVGVTTMKVTSKLDTGPILMQRATKVLPGETNGLLHSRLAEMGAELLRETIDALGKGEIEPRPQDESRASYAPPIKPSDGHLNPHEPAKSLEARSRGVTPWPGASMAYGDKRLKFFGLSYDETPPEGEPGRIVDLGPRGYRVACGQGHLYLAQVQHPGRRPVAAQDAARGAGPRMGEMLR